MKDKIRGHIYDAQSENAIRIETNKLYKRIAKLEKRIKKLKKHK